MWADAGGAATTGLNLGPPSLGAGITSALSLHTYFGSPFLPVFRKRVKGEESQLDGGSPQAGVRVPRAVATCRVGPPAPPSLHPAPPSVFLGWPGPRGSPTGALPSFLPAFEVRCSGVCGVCRGLRSARQRSAGGLPSPPPPDGCRPPHGAGPGQGRAWTVFLQGRTSEPPVGRAGLAARGAARHPSPPPGSLSFFRASECYSHRISILLLLFFSLQQHSVERATRRENGRKDSTPTPCRAPACSSATDIPET